MISFYNSTTIGESPALPAGSPRAPSTSPCGAVATRQPRRPRRSCTSIGRSSVGRPMPRSTTRRRAISAGSLPAQQHDYLEYDAFGCCRSHLGICRASLQEPLNFDLVHSGLWNYMDLMKREDSETAECMVLLEGERIGGGVERQVISVTGCVWMPHALDFTVRDWIDPRHATAQPIELPCEVCSRRRPCVVSDRFMVVDSLMSVCM